MVKLIFNVNNPPPITTNVLTTPNSDNPVNPLPVQSPTLPLPPYMQPHEHTVAPLPTPLNTIQTPHPTPPQSTTNPQPTTPQPIPPQPTPAADSFIHPDSKLKGRPRKFTGPGWDNLSKEEYQLKARAIHNTDANAKRKKKYKGPDEILLPMNQDAATPLMYANVPEVAKAFQEYINRNNALQHGIAAFKHWCNVEGMETERLRAKYLSLIHGIETKE